MDTTITSTGALSVSSGAKTGRVPKTKRIVYDTTTRDTVWWGDVNIPMDPKGYTRNRSRVIDYLNMVPRVFVIDGYAGSDDDYRINARILCTRPYHALFMKNMLLRDNELALETNFGRGPDFTVMNAGEFRADPSTEDVDEATSVAVNFADKEMCILGTQYAGEMKKGIFGVMHFYMPKRNALSMHASANVGEDGKPTVLFGLSGTGKTTLSADPKRHLLGDDEHVWCSNGIFNIEGGCYAKANGLSKEIEPEIFNAVKFGTVLENVEYIDDEIRTVDYNKTNIT